MVTKKVIKSSTNIGRTRRKRIRTTKVSDVEIIMIV
jgi:hypothetical protein